MVVNRSISPVRHSVLTLAKKIDAGNEGIIASVFLTKQASSAETQQCDPTLDALNELVHAATALKTAVKVLLVSRPEGEDSAVKFLFGNEREITISDEIFKMLGLKPEELCQLDKINVLDRRIIFFNSRSANAKTISVDFQQLFGKCRINSVYVGTLKADIEAGYGICIRNGIVCKGNWRDGQLNGVAVFSDRNCCYMGEWEKDMRCGHGVLVKANGIMYDGNWKEHELDGLAAMVFSLGSFRCSGWRHGNLKYERQDFNGVVVNHDGSEFYSANSPKGRQLLEKLHEARKKFPDEPADMAVTIPLRVRLYMQDNKMHYTAMETASGDQIIPWNNFMLVVRKDDILDNAGKLIFSKCVVKNVDKKHSIECIDVLYNEATHSYEGTMKFYTEDQLQGEYRGKFVLSHEGGVMPCGSGVMTVGDTTYTGQFAMGTGKEIIPPGGVRLEAGTVSYQGGKHTDKGKWNKNGEPIDLHEITYINSDRTRLIYTGTKVDKDGNPKNKQELQLVSFEGHIFCKVDTRINPSHKDDEVVFGGYKVASSKKAPDNANKNEIFYPGGPDVVFYASAKTPDKFNIYYKNDNGSVVSITLTDDQRSEIRNMQKPILQETSLAPSTMGQIVTAVQVKMWIDSGKLDTLPLPNDKYKVKYSENDERDEYEGSLNGTHQAMGNGKLTMKNGDVLTGSFKVVNGVTLFEGNALFAGIVYEKVKIADITRPARFRLDPYSLNPYRLL